MSEKFTMFKGIYYVQLLNDLLESKISPESWKRIIMFRSIAFHTFKTNFTFLDGSNAFHTNVLERVSLVAAETCQAGLLPIQLCLSVNTLCFTPISSIHITSCDILHVLKGYKF